MSYGLLQPIKIPQQKFTVHTMYEALGDGQVGVTFATTPALALAKAQAIFGSAVFVRRAPEPKRGPRRKAATR